MSERLTEHVSTEAPALRLVLRWSEPDGGKRQLRLDAGAVGIGAHADNLVCLDDPYVSRFHCRIVRRGGRAWIEDLDSTNGTFLDGVAIRSAELTAGCALRVGDQALRVDDDGPASAAPVPGVITRDRVVGAALELLRRTAPSRVPVLLLGESGTGKEVAARALHELSRRCDGPFVPVNCGAIAPELAEAELFGHEKGSFTGAIGSSVGAFGAAEGGTLFLDEVGDLPLPLQVKLLRALESGEVKPVGAARPRQMDVRLVCATHRDLRACVRAGSFREDLYYRVCGLTIRLPPLRERPDDVLPLAEHFLALECRGDRRAFSADARAALRAYRWPGNVRELRHVVQLAVVLSDGPAIRASALRLGESAARAAAEGNVLELRGRSLRELEELAVRDAYERLGGHRRAMARELGIARSSLLRKLDELGLRGVCRAAGQ
jgi:DNA-binding NtrC family response regulator